VGVFLAAISAVLNSPHMGLSCLIGIGLIILSEFVKSLMVISEEYLMKKIHCDPFFMLGLQGVYSSIILGFGLVLSWFVIPGNDMGKSWESLSNTVQLASESTTIIVILSIIPIFIAGHFMCSVEVTHLLSAVHNAIAAVLMTAVIWLLELFIHYVIDSHYGYAWGRYSAIQLVGFGFVVVAMLVYDGSILRLPALFKYEAVDVDSQIDPDPKISDDLPNTEIYPVELDTTTSNNSDTI